MLPLASIAKTTSVIVLAWAEETRTNNARVAKAERNIAESVTKRARIRSYVRTRIRWQFRTGTCAGVSPAACAISAAAPRARQVSAPDASQQRFHDVDDFPLAAGMGASVVRDATASFDA